MRNAQTLTNGQDQGEIMSAGLSNGGFEIVPPIPKPEGKIYDAHGDTVRPANPTIMARLDAKTAEQVTLSKGTLWLLGAGVVILNLVLSYGGSMIAWARDDQSQKEKIIQIQQDVQGVKDNVKEMRDDFKEIQKNLQADSIQKAKIDGFKAGVAETQSDRK